MYNIVSFSKGWDFMSYAFLAISAFLLVLGMVIGGTVQIVLSFVACGFAIIGMIMILHSILKHTPKEKRRNPRERADNEPARRTSSHTDDSRYRAQRFKK